MKTFWEGILKGPLLGKCLRKELFQPFLSSCPQSIERNRGGETRAEMMRMMAEWKGKFGGRTLDGGTTGKNAIVYRFPHLSTRTRATICFSSV